MASLGCREIIANGDLRARIAEEVLEAGLDGPLLEAVFQRMAADAFAARERLSDSDTRLPSLHEAMLRYRTAEMAFEVSGLGKHAKICARLRRRTLRVATRVSQHMLPGIAPDPRDSTIEASTIGFSSRQCLAVGVRPRELLEVDGRRREPIVFFHHLGEITLPKRSLEKLLIGAPDLPELPVAEASDVRGNGSGVSFDLNVRLQPTIASLLGVRVPGGRPTGDLRRIYVMARGKDCFLQGHARLCDVRGSAKLPMEARRRGLHRIELIVAQENRSSRHFITVNLQQVEQSI
ncbi:hypothetical protein R1A27_16470 [Methylobacterium sp. NMS12]|uniref:hypothetical protein n=1 Tax=Methylobacterium sp. NMS12 TaxID=3079766 RepID=UPI003F8832E0